MFAQRLILPTKSDISVRTFPFVVLYRRIFFPNPIFRCVRSARERPIDPIRRYGDAVDGSAPLDALLVHGSLLTTSGFVLVLVMP